MRSVILSIALIILPKFACADILHINDGGEAVDSRTAGAITPAGNKDFRENYSTRPGSGWVFGFSFKESTAKFKWKVEVVVENKPREAGHNHDNPPPELFYFPAWPDKKTVARLDGATIYSPLLDQNQRFTVHLASVSYATEVTARGTYTQFYYGETLNPTLTHTLDIKTPGLEPLPRNDRLYKSVGETITHPYNHYGTAITIAALKDLAATWRNTYPASPLLEFGNISLPWGGVFDTNSDWKTTETSHAFGIAVDIGKGSFSSDERAAIMKLICKSGFRVYNRTEDKKEQYHIVHKNEFIRLKGLNWPVYLPDKTNGATIDCCAAKTGTRDYQKCTGFSETVKNRSPIPVPPLSR